PRGGRRDAWPRRRPTPAAAGRRSPPRGSPRARSAAARAGGRSRREARRARPRSPGTRDRRRASPRTRGRACASPPGRSRGPARWSPSGGTLPPIPLQSAAMSERAGAGAAFEAFVALIARLRAPDGCPWDREQTHHSLKPMTIEEAYEVVEAIEHGDDEHLAGELGDLLLQVVFHAQIAAEAGRFDVAQVVERVSAKMVRRHPHVFGTHP